MNLQAFFAHLADSAVLRRRRPPSAQRAFISEQGRPYALAPAYDMLPIGFAPAREGRMPDTLPAVIFHPGVSNQTWHLTLELALDFLARIRSDARFSTAFGACIDAMSEHMELAREKARWLG